jgi:hypothetical protein
MQEETGAQADVLRANPRITHRSLHVRHVDPAESPRLLTPIPPIASRSPGLDWS